VEETHEDYMDSPLPIQKPLSLKVLDDQNAQEINPLNAQPPIFTIGESNIEPINTEGDDIDNKEIILQELVMIEKPAKKMKTKK